MSAPIQRPRRNFELLNVSVYRKSSQTIVGNCTELNGMVRKRSCARSTRAWPAFYFGYFITQYGVTRKKYRLTSHYLGVPLFCRQLFHQILFHQQNIIETLVLVILFGVTNIYFYFFYYVEILLNKYHLITDFFKLS